MPDYWETERYRRQIERERREQIRDTTIPDPSKPDEPTLELASIYVHIRLDLIALEEHIARFYEAPDADPRSGEAKRLDRAVVLAKTAAKEIKRVLRRRGVKAPSREVKKIVDISLSCSDLPDPGAFLQ